MSIEIAVIALYVLLGISMVYSAYQNRVIFNLKKELRNFKNFEKKKTSNDNPNKRI